MQALLESERQRADDSEIKYLEAQRTIELMKLEEIERTVLQYQYYVCFCLFHHKIRSSMQNVKHGLFNILKPNERYILESIRNEI